MLQLSDVSFAYDAAPVLHGVGFSVEAGRFAALLGPNGAGKTTLLGLITRQLRPQTGTIRIGGLDIGKSPRQALRRMGIVFQAPTLDLDLTVAQNLSYFGGLHGLSPRRALAQAEEALLRFQLTDKLDRKVRTLSGGQRRQVEIVRALVHRPDLLLLDEPTAGLDVPTRRAIVDHVHGLAADHGACVLWATHLVDEVRPSDELVVLHQGLIVDSGTFDRVTARLGTADLAAIAGGTLEAVPAPVATTGARVPSPGARP